MEREGDVGIKDVPQLGRVVAQGDGAFAGGRKRRYDEEEEEAVGRCRHADAFVADEGALRNSQEVPSFLGIY